VIRLLSEDLGVVPIPRETVQTRIHQQLRDLLMRGRFQPGQPLKMQEMADLFGTSTQPVREAIRQLVAEKALEALPNRTARVPILSLERLEDLCRARIAIESLAAELATERATKADLERLERLIEGETHADDTAQAELSVAQNQAFHFQLYQLSGSTVLPPIIEGLWLQVGPFIRKSAEYFDARAGRGAEFHIAAIKALRRRDAVRVGKAIAADINRSLDVIREVMFTADAAA
jgi:DNA-binding GntR family transcriptional regulator